MSISISKSTYLTYPAILMLTLTTTALLYLVNGHSLIGIDDANIYQVYMRNFSNGYGFVYNAGGEHVEGFTSLLWTLIGAVFFRMSNRPEIFLLALNIFIVSFAIWKVCCFINWRLSNERFFSTHVILFLLLLIALPGYFEWTVLSLLETGLWSTLLILLTLNSLEFDIRRSSTKENLYFSSLLLLLVCCRPESMLWGAFFIAAKTFKACGQTRNFKQTLVWVIPSLFVFLSGVGLLIMWRLSYFGYPFPNTYYAKVSQDPWANLRLGTNYVKVYFINNPFAFLIFLISFQFIINSLTLRRGLPGKKNPARRRSPYYSLAFTC